VLEGKNCFITGGARGIGLGIARACAERGAKLILVDTNGEALEAARAELSPVADVHTLLLDVTDRARYCEVAEQVERELGPVHALFNNAGVVDSVSPSAMKGEVWDWVVDVNLHGVYNGIQAFVPRMIARGEGGLIVNTSSIAGLFESGSGFAYHATKFAVVGLSESLRRELTRHGISVSVVCPGQVATGIVKNTQQQRPAAAEPYTTRVKQILDTAHHALQESGISIDAAGRAVVEGALAGQPWIFTDGQDYYRLLLQQRTEDLLGYIPGSPDLEPAELEEQLTTASGSAP
jgi:NAD(P)-dependent dehydrogenase (short-subunit alcohol dehydrogenase family)